MSGANMTQKETAAGWLYYAFQLMVLPVLLKGANALLPHPLGDAQLNFLFFLINFISIVLIFHRFFSQSISDLFKRFWLFLQAVFWGLLAYAACKFLLDRIILLLRPGFINFNDQGIGSMAGTRFTLMLIGTVLLVPPVEEIFYRGLIFRSFYSTSPVGAYLLSAVFFSCVHIIGFLGVYSGADLLLSFIQYLPAGFLLAWSYRRSGTIFSPIVIHALVNLLGIWLMR